MPFITREDGERFVIPSYRDILSAKKSNLLRREILLLSSNYGEYIVLQRKNVNQYEIAFSPDPGYLLGESIWNYFKRPQDLIYCEAVPNTSEAILVIVKSGSVYLDGVFPVDVIVDELLVFRTQQNYFEIYTYGDVPISKQPQEGKFDFADSSVKSFSVLDKPVFPTLPTVKTFQLQPVESVLRAKGIGVFPVGRLLLVLAAAAFVVILGYLISSHKKELPQVIVRATNPFQGYYDTLNSPDPADQVRWIASNLWLLTTIQGWYPQSVLFTDYTLDALMKSEGTRTNILFDWALHNNGNIDVRTDGFHLTIEGGFFNRGINTTIMPLTKVVATIIDRLSYVLPGNNLDVGLNINRGRYSELQLTITFIDITPTTLDLISRQLRGLPLVLLKLTARMSNNGLISGTIILKALGS